MNGSAMNPEVKVAPASAAASPAGERTVVPTGAQPASSESPRLSRRMVGAGADDLAARDERAAINRSPFMS